MYIKSLKQKIAIHIALLIDGLSRTSDKSPSASRIDRQTRVGTWLISHNKPIDS